MNSENIDSNENQNNQVIIVENNNRYEENPYFVRESEVIYEVFIFLNIFLLSISFFGLIYLMNTNFTLIPIYLFIFFILILGFYFVFRDYKEKLDNLTLKKI